MHCSGQRAQPCPVLRAIPAMSLCCSSFTDNRRSVGRQEGSFGVQGGSLRRIGHGGIMAAALPRRLPGSVQRFRGR